MVTPDNQFNKGAAITPSDATDLAQITDGVWVSVGGTVAAVFQDGSVINITAPAGLLPLRVRRINATGTAATGLVALYQN